MSETISNLISRAPLTQEERDAAAAGMVRKALGYRLASEVDPALSRPDLTAGEQAEWEAYRLALLDITEQSGFPHKVFWPTRPGQGT
jgi:hypothetical protein